MNLADLLRRQDRAIREVVGHVEGGCAGREPHLERVVRFGRGAVLRLGGVHEFSVVRAFPRTWEWTMLRRFGLGGSLTMRLVDEGGRHGSTVLAPAFPRLGAQRTHVQLSWPDWAGRASGLGMVLEQTGRWPATLGIGPVINPRERILRLLRGRGVEVGPGMNPQVLARADLSVTYVETLPADHWVKLYRKIADPAPGPAPLWDRYVIGSAEELDVIDDGTLDFVFSNHVFEHLANPLGVLDNWLRKLKSGGVVGAVVPDARYSFDLRQPWSTLDELVRERALGGFELGRHKYERWCRYTAPYNSPDDLMARRYSIHAHYYVPQLLAELAAVLRREGLVSGAFLDTAPNNRDIGFVLWKA